MEHGEAFTVFLTGDYRWHWPVGRAMMRSSLERDFCSLNLGQVKSDTVLSTACLRCDISSKGAKLLRRNDAKLNRANSLHVSA